MQGPPDPRNGVDHCLFICQSSMRKKTAVRTRLGLSCPSATCFLSCTLQAPLPRATVHTHRQLYSQDKSIPVMDDASAEKKRTRGTQQPAEQGSGGANANGHTDLSDKDGDNAAADGDNDVGRKGKRRNLGRVDAGDDELLLPDADDVDDTGNGNTTANDQTGEDTDDVVVLSWEGVATRPIAHPSSRPAITGDSPGGDDGDGAEGDFSDVEIISARQTPDVVTSVEPWEGRRGAEAVAQDADVSVELVEDWFGPASAGNVGTRQNISVDDTDESDGPGGGDGGDDDDDDDDDDDLVMLDGKPTMSTDQLLDQIKEKDGNSATNETSATTAKTFQDVTCVICMDPIKDAVAAACGHVFCAGCIYRALASSREPGHGGTGPGGRRGKCPMCRKVVAYKNLVWLKVRYTKPPSTV